jgi:hypothetical protein
MPERLQRCEFAGAGYGNRGGREGMLSYRFVQDREGGSEDLVLLIECGDKSWSKIVQGVGAL